VLYPRAIPIEAQSLIGTMLHSDPMQRPTLKEIRNHPWMRAGAPPRKSKAVPTGSLPITSTVPKSPTSPASPTSPSNNATSPTSTGRSSTSAAQPIAISSARPISIPGRPSAASTAPVVPFSMTDGGTVPETPRVALREELMAGGKKRPAEREVVCRTCGKRLTARVKAGHVSLKKESGTGSGSLTAHGIASRESKNAHGASSRVPGGGGVSTPAVAEPYVISPPSFPACSLFLSFIFV
jgi:serine/threonine protein kinase